MSHDVFAPLRLQNENIDELGVSIDFENVMIALLASYNPLL